MKLYMPQRVIFDPISLDYPLGQKIYDYFKGKPVEIINAAAQNAVRHIPGSSPAEKLSQAKRTLFVTINKDKKLDTCRPSADYQFSLIKGCPGFCEYCYLQTTQGERPYLRVYVNLEDIFDIIKAHIDLNEERETTFEAASLGDPLALEHITGSLAKTIEFFSCLEKGRLRVVTKYSQVDSLLGLEHKQKTDFRISINTDYVITNFEHNTVSLNERIEAIAKMARAGYPVGFLLAPIMLYENWQKDYEFLLNTLQSRLGAKLSQRVLSFELIQHRFTKTAKELILQRYPETKLDMAEESRMLKWGRYGRYKFVYKKEEGEEMKEFFSRMILEKFPQADIKYFT